MKVLEKGHIYEPENRLIIGEDGRKLQDLVAPQAIGQTITFINKEPGAEHSGTTTQEVIRILIDRTRYCNNCQPHYLNEHVIYHLRQALVKHEMRALERKAEKGDITPEYTPIGDDGHFALPDDAIGGPNHTPQLTGYKPDWERDCLHTSNKHEEA